MATEFMSNEIALLAIFLLSIFVGFEVVSKVSTTLHTPLMSGANAIHGVILVGAIVVADHAKTNLELGLALAAVVLATINMVAERNEIVMQPFFRVFIWAGVNG